MVLGRDAASAVATPEETAVAKRMFLRSLRVTSRENGLDLLELATRHHRLVGTRVHFGAVAHEAGVERISKNLVYGRD